MHRMVLACGLLLAACGVDPDEAARQPSLYNVSVTVLKPYCGAAQCHSSFRNEKNRAFDTVHATCQALVGMGDVIPGDDEGSFLISVMTRTVKRMPYDQPMPEGDLQFIKDWIKEGANGLPATMEQCP